MENKENQLTIGKLHFLRRLESTIYLTALAFYNH